MGLIGVSSRIPFLIRQHFGGVLLLQVALLFPSAFSQSSANPKQTAAAGSANTSSYVPEMIFEVASVRESKPDFNLGFNVSGRFEPVNSSHLILENNSFSNLLGWAYPGLDHKVIGFNSLPGELQHALFNVRAEGGADTDERLAKLPKAQVKLEQRHMMQVLLAERFNLKVHWESRNADTYDLIVTNREKLRSTGLPPSAEEVKAFGDYGVPPIYQKGGSSTGFEYIAHGATMNDMAEMLASQFGAPVNDKTGLTGTYDFDLKTYQVKSSERNYEETNPWPPLETAIREQLGLKLVPSHGPVRTLIIDHAEMPSPN